MLSCIYSTFFYYHANSDGDGNYTETKVMAKSKFVEGKFSLISVETVPWEVILLAGVIMDSSLSELTHRSHRE